MRMNCYTILHILTNEFNFNKYLLMFTGAVFLHKTRNGHSKFLVMSLGITTKDKMTLPMY